MNKLQTGSIRNVGFDDPNLSPTFINKSYWLSVSRLFWFPEELETVLGFGSFGDIRYFKSAFVLFSDLVELLGLEEPLITEQFQQSLRSSRFSLLQLVHFHILNSS
jgi:hypothetical protein